MSTRTYRHAFAAVAVFAALQLAGCATGGAPTVNFPPEVQALGHQPLLVGDDEKRHLGERPIYALLDVSPQGDWRLMQLSHSVLEPQRDNQEVLRFDTKLQNVFPTFEAGRYTFDSDPISGKRSNFRVEVDRALKPYSLPKTNRKRGYTIASSEFSRTDFDTILGSGTSSHVARYWVLDSVAVRKAIVQTDLLTKARAFAAGDRTFASAPPALRPMTIGDQVWLVTPDDSDGRRFYFVPHWFESVSGNILEEGSTLNLKIDGKPTPWETVKRFKVYEHRSIPAYQSVPERNCAGQVFEVVGKPAHKDSICGVYDQWLHSFSAKSPSLGSVWVSAALGMAYAPDGRPLDVVGHFLSRHQHQKLRALDLSNRQRYEIRVLTGEEAATARRQFR